MSTYLNDRQRIEFSVPALLLLALVSKARFGIGSEDGTEAPGADDRAAIEASVQLKAWTGEAMMQPFRDLDPRKQASLLRRARRETCEVVDELDGASAIKIAMTLYYFLCELGERGLLDIVEGSEIHKAIDMLIPMMGYGFSKDRLDKSAQKQAIHLLERFQRKGYYRTLQDRTAA